jgi:hypothetical protein
MLNLWKKVTVTLLVSLMLIVVILSGIDTNHPSQTPNMGFQRYDKNPLLSGTPSSWSDYFCSDPSVIQIPTTGQYVMFFFGANSSNIPQIGYATSSDLFHWISYSGNPIITNGSIGQWDNKAVGKPSAIINGDQIYVYYACAGSIGVVVSGCNFDLTTWNKYPENPILKDLADAPTVVYDNITETFYMFYYHSNGTDFAVEKYATSNNLLTWNIKGIALSGTGRARDWNASILSSSVMQFPSGLWMMAYNTGIDSGFSEPEKGTFMGLAYSTNLISWTNCSTTPILNYTNSQNWDNLNIFAPSLFYSNNRIYLFYNGLGVINGVTSERIGVALLGFEH